MPMNMGMAAVLYYVAEACQVLGFLVVLPGACATAYRWARKDPYRPGYRPRHARQAARPSARQTARRRSAPRGAPTCPVNRGAHPLLADSSHRLHHHRHRSRP